MTSLLQSIKRQNMLADDATIKTTDECHRLQLDLSQVKGANSLENVQVIYARLTSLILSLQKLADRRWKLWAQNMYKTNRSSLSHTRSPSPKYIPSSLRRISTLRHLPYANNSLVSGWWMTEIAFQRMFYPHLPCRALNEGWYPCPSEKGDDSTKYAKWTSIPSIHYIQLPSF